MKRLTQDQVIIVHDYLKDHQQMIRGMTTTEIAANIKENFGFDVSASTIRKRGDSLGISWKRRTRGTVSKDVAIVANAVVLLSQKLGKELPDDVLELATRAQE